MDKKIRYFGCILVVLIFVGSSCNQNEPTNKEKEKDPVLEKIGGDYYEDLIRTPINPDGTIDTTNLPKIQFDHVVHDFGNFTDSEKQTHEFPFVNTGNGNLILLNVKTSCGCTVASYDEAPIPPGGSGSIKINYDPKNRKGIQEKKIIVTSNTFPNKMELSIIANIINE